MQCTLRWPEFVNVAAQAEIRDVVSKHLLAFLISSVYIWYDTTYNDGERPGVQNWDSTALPTMWMMWQAWQSSVQSDIMHGLRLCFCTSAEKCVFGYGVILVVLTRTHVGKVARALVMLGCIELVRLCFMRNVDKCENWPSFAIVYFVLVLMAYLGETPHYAKFVGALIILLLLCSHILARKQGWVRYFVLSLMLLRVVELLQPPVCMQPRIERVYKTLEFLMVMLTYLTTIVLAILFGIADVVVALYKGVRQVYKDAVGMYNAMFPAPPMPALCAPKEGSHRARSMSPVAKKRVAHAAKPHVTHVAKQHATSVTGKDSTSNCMNAVAEKTSSQKNRIFHDEVPDASGSGSGQRQSTRKRSKSAVEKATPAKRKKQR